MSRRRGLKIAAVVLVGLGLVGLVAALILAPRLARRMAVDKAREHGVELDCDDLALRPGRVRLSQCRFSLVGLSSIHGTIELLEVTLTGFEPAAVQIDGMHAVAEGAAPTLAVGISEWTKTYPRAYRLDTTARKVELDWLRDPGSPRWLALRDGVLERTRSGATFRAEHTLLGACARGEPCPDLGKVGAAWTADDATVMLGFGEEDVNAAPLRIEVRHALPKPTADITLAPVKLEKLAGPFGVKLPLKNVTASGGVHLEMPKGKSGGTIIGHLSARLEGYEPPHPRELDGFVFGDVTTLEAKLALDEARERADLSEAKVTAGAFKLSGSGSVAREGPSGRVKLELYGNVPCGALVGAAADSFLGKTLGGIAGGLAKQLIGGAVAVTVKIDAKSDDLENAKVERVIGIGCGLRPQKLGDLDPSHIPLPSLPSSLPPLPDIDFGIEPPKTEKRPK